MEPQNTAPIAAWFAERVYWVFLGVMLLNIIQRKHQAQAGKKRMATLLVGVSLFGLLVVAQSINHFGGSDILFYIALVGYAAVLYTYRDRMLPFRIKSPVDGRWLNFQEIMFDDLHGDGPKESSEEEEEEPDEEEPVDQ
jgi:hypothetical protein